ncbi:Nudix family hydrolase [Inmirania thermothiophila]|uniref:8-oxo-dGTP diphosphatase n=1 Tax=Inmirania thermothiophila TaxID=1750597 RepID=A0A3N1XSS1_9GAMM|nr:Nudix family hydrolase [Inmirania thermothiophila]ROR29696.1 8-oxo-dGTPase [Inmirania thermothiophila]
MTAAARLHVVAGILRDAAGRVLVTRRPAGRHLEGLWEFPGGKLEPGEAPLAGLARELAEELGIQVREAWPLIAVPWDYPERRILLDVWEVRRHEGRPRPREGQALAWVRREALAGLAMPPADRPVLGALALPDLYLVTPPQLRDEAALRAGLEKALARGVRLVQLRLPGAAEATVRRLAAAARTLCRAAGARLLVNGDPALAEAVGADGVHLSASWLRRLEARPLPAPQLVGASCHDRAELARARAIGADFAVLSPVRPTPSHPDAPALGWSRFAHLARGAGLPVYALGGVGPADLARARHAGARGIAAIRALWP